MKPIPPRRSPGEIVYPESDGKPIGDTSKQIGWIFKLYGNLTAQFRERADVFVAADLFWYPVEGHPELRTAPDGLVVFGRPKGDRGSYRQWEEEDIPVTVAFEVLSPNDTPATIAEKLAFYERHEVEEYYLYDPESIRLQGYLRRNKALRPVEQADGFVSPRLGIRFDLSGPEMVVYGPDGERFLTFEEAFVKYKEEHQRLEAARTRLRIAEARCLTARLAELSRKARMGQASAEELQELERLSEDALG